MARVVLVISTTKRGDTAMNNHKPPHAELAPGAFMECPRCGLPAEISDRFTLGGAPEPVQHVKVVCVRRHWYTLPVDMVPVSASVRDDPSTSGMTRQRTSSAELR